MRLRNIVAAALIASALATSGGLIATVSESTPQTIAVLDGTRMIHTVNGWRQWVPGAYSDSLTGGLVLEYGEAAPAPASLPTTAGQWLASLFNTGSKSTK